MSETGLNVPWSTKASRRTESDMFKVRRAIKKVLECEHPLTARQVFYRLVVGGHIEKTESEYKRTVIRLLTEMRMASISEATQAGWPSLYPRIPFDWIIDESRGIQETLTFDNVNEALSYTARCYRRNALRELSDEHVEIWIEKEGLASIVWDVAGDYDVPVVPTKGFQSVTKLHEGFERISNADKAQCVIYQFGDYDPSGVLIPKVIKNRLSQFCEAYDLAVPKIVRVALTQAQIEQYDLPSRPTKRDGNTHAKDFDGDSTEIEALTSSVLRGMVRQCIEQHIDPEQLAELRAEEDDERQRLIDSAGRAA